jgi:hypothetical protein
MMPRGSRRAFTARSISMPVSPISARIHAAWSAPIAWWCVIVPPASTMASHAAVFAARHCSISRLRSCAAMNVK